MAIQAAQMPAPKLPPRSLREALREENPVAAELVDEVEATFLPLVQGAVELIR